jgi:hypothetical protein
MMICFKEEILRKIIDNNAGNLLSLKKIRRLYMEEDNSFYFSTETLHKYMIRHLKYVFRMPVIKHYYVLQNCNFSQKICMKKFVCKTIGDDDDLYFGDE